LETAIGLLGASCIRSALPRNLEPFGYAGLSEREGDRQLAVTPLYKHPAMFIRYPFSFMLVGYYVDAVVEVEDSQKI